MLQVWLGSLLHLYSHSTTISVGRHSIWCQSHALRTVHGNRLWLSVQPLAATQFSRLAYQRSVPLWYVLQAVDSPQRV